jgi:hypothetical protein
MSPIALLVRLSHMKSFLIVVLGGAIACAIIGFGLAQDVNQPVVHAPRLIDQELDVLAKDLDLTPQQQVKVRPILQKHHDRIESLLDRHSNSSRQALAPQIRAISDQTHREIGAVLTDRQKQLAQSMQERTHAGEEEDSGPSGP